MPSRDPFYDSLLEFNGTKLDVYGPDAADSITMAIADGQNVKPQLVECVTQRFGIGCNDCTVQIYHPKTEYPEYTRYPSNIIDLTYPIMLFVFGPSRRFWFRRNDRRYDEHHFEVGHGQACLLVPPASTDWRWRSTSTSDDKEKTYVVTVAKELNYSFAADGCPV